MSESEVKAGLEESLPDRETSISINGIKEHTSKEILQNGETNKIIANGDIEMKDLSENKEKDLDLKSSSNEETEAMDVSEKPPGESEKDLVNGSDSDERDKLKDNQQSSSVSVNNSVNNINEKEFNKDSTETESDKSTNSSSEKETKDPSTSDDKLNNVDNSENNSNSETKSLPERTPKKTGDDDDDDDLQITGEVIKDNSSDIEMIEESDPLAISESDAKKIQQKEQQKQLHGIGKPKVVRSNPSVKPKVTAKDPSVIIIDTNTLLKNQGNLAAAVAASSSPATQPTSSNVNIQAAAMAAAVAATGAMPTQQGLQSAYMNALQQDDAYVIEAPSFIVPYVMEGKPKEPIKKFLSRINKDLEEFEKKESKKDEKENEDKDKEKKEKDKTEESKEKSKSEENKKEEDTSDKDETKEDSEETEAKSDTKEGDSVDKESEDSQNSENSENRITEGDDDKENKRDSDSVVDLEKEEKKEEEKKEEKKDEEKKEDLSHLGRWEPYYKSALGNFFLDLGLNQAQEFLQADLMRMQKRKLDKMKTTPPKEAQYALRMLERQLNSTKSKNKHLHVPLKTCKFCNFRTESELVMERHLESPHMVNYTYKCNFCEFETRGPQVILFHMEAEHNVRGRLERAPAFFQCSLCPYEDNNKSKMTRHSFSCAKKFKPEKNCELMDWEPPAKIPKVHRGRPNTLGKAFEPVKMPNLLPKGLANMLPQNINLNNLNLQQATNLINSAVAQGRGRGRPVGSYKGVMPNTRGIPGRGGALSPGMSPSLMQQQVAAAQQQMTQMYQQQSGRVPRILPSQQSASSVSLLPGLGASSSITIQSVGNKGGAGKSPQQPSISITPLPRGGSQQQPAKGSSSSGAASATPTRDASGKPSFVICEICDGYIKDLEQLRNHMNLIHKVKIHPKMIYNRPPLNCQKCQHRFFTDQGLERHLLGTHGLVTSSMQEAANKGKDAGRCPICGKVFQWKLLNHVSRDHKMTLKPAHLSYKCTVCTATFNMYRLFENHVYSAHSVVNKNKGEGSKKQSSSVAAGQ